jgi:hypothetical protein
LGFFGMFMGVPSTGRGGRYPAGQGERSDLDCRECGEFLVRTPSGWLACPRRHSKLTCEEQPGEESYGTRFEAEL